MKLLKTIFISPDEPRLRAGWRLIIQTSVMLILAIAFAIPLVIASFFFSVNFENLLLNQLFQVIAFTVSIFLARKFLDRRSFVSLGLKLNRRAALDILVGIGITLIMMGLIFGIEIIAGWLDFQAFAWQTESVGTVLSQFLIWLVTFILVGWNEELLSRGYHLQTLESGLNTLWAVLLSSAVFGVLHIRNPNANWIGVLGIFLAGIFLSYGYLRTRQLWLPIGLHIGWNFFEGVVFGFPVSGTQTFQLVRTSVDGPILWTGGEFGPEAGLVLLPALAIGAFLIFTYTQNQAPKLSGDKDNA